MKPEEWSSLEEPQVLFLGTQSMKPTQYRGASAIYVMLKGQGILMDCAEGSYGQLMDHFGGDTQLVSDLLLKTRVVFITHIHGDHQLGVLKIMHERDSLHGDMPDESQKLYVVTPSPMMKWMELFVSDSLKHPDMVVLVPSKSFNPESNYYYQFYDGSKYRDVEAKEILDKEDPRPMVEECPAKDVTETIKNFVPLCDKSKELQAHLQSTLGIKLLAVEVDHCPQSYACLLVGDAFGPGNKLIYSGDTRPCQNFKNYALNASLIIHEATLGAGMEAEAESKKHTTTREAIDLIKDCNPWRSILTHFSCRYMKLPEILPDHQDHKVMVAFDHLRLSFKHLEWAYRVVPILEQVFAEDTGSEESKEEDDKPIKK